MQTAKSIRDLYPRNMPGKLAELMYQLGDAEVEALASKSEISIGDILNLERRGKCLVADALFAKCSIEAREILLHDEHPHVRSIANISLRALSKS